MNKTFSIKTAGAAGQGIKSTGARLAMFLATHGFNVYNYHEYPSLIRGGHTTVQTIFSLDPVNAPILKLDVLIAFNIGSVDLHLSELNPGGILIYDDKMEAPKVEGGIKVVPAPLSDQVKCFDSIINILGDSEMAATFRLPSNSNKMVITGSVAISSAAIAAGLQFSAIYPMSPISGILDHLAKHQEKYGYVYKQPEDEIAAINMTIGASFAGARVMTATSGGGFCLMTEGYGLAGMTETPVVIILGMRPGPATGLPTWNEQGDLQFVLNAHQGDFPRIVLAAGDNEEAFNMTLKAFNLAERYTCPVVVLVDKNICEQEQSFPPFDYTGYQVEAVNRRLPGTGVHFVANSDEHDEEGFSTEDKDLRIKQMDKRMQKLEDCARNDMTQPQLIGPAAADLTIVSWGSCKGAILDAMKNFDRVNYLHLTWFSPFPSRTVGEILSKAKKILAIEQNYSGQMTRLIREKTGIEIKNKYLKYDGRMFFKEEVEEAINVSLRGE